MCHSALHFISMRADLFFPTSTGVSVSFARVQSAFLWYGSYGQSLKTKIQRHKVYISKKWMQFQIKTMTSIMLQ